MNDEIVAMLEAGQAAGKPIPKQLSYWPTGPFVDFDTVSTDDCKYIIWQCGGTGYFDILTGSAAQQGSMYNYCWQQGGSGQGADTYPALNPDLMFHQTPPPAYTPPPNITQAVEGYNTWFNNVLIGGGKHKPLSAK
jgi:hypothetical protein